MKSLKLAMVAALVACTMVSLASTDNIKMKAKPKKVVDITFVNAVQDPGLVVAMYRQIDPSFLKNYQHLYLVKVNYDGATYRILGSRQSWVSFFAKPWKYLMDSKTVGIPDN